MQSLNIISHVIYVALFVIGHQGVQVNETCSNVSLPVALDSESKVDFNH